MIKTKSYLVLALITLLTFSCSKDEVETIETVQEIQVLEFDSKVALEQEIDQVLEFKKRQELSISKKLFGESLKNFDFSAKQPDVEKEEKINQDVLFESVKLYHQEKLNAVYELRKEKNFTSIQSIADEINFLALINPKKAGKLTNKFQNLLVKTKFGTSTIFDDRKANVINTDGEVFVNGQKQETATSVQMKNSARIKEGVLAYSTDNIFAVTWHTGARRDSGERIFTKLGGWIILNGVSYPFATAFNPRSDSYSRIRSINADGLCGPTLRTLKYASGFGPVVEIAQTISYAICRDAYYPQQGKVSGDFATVLANGQILRASGTAAY